MVGSVLADTCCVDKNTGFSPAIFEWTTCPFSSPCPGASPGPDYGASPDPEPGLGLIPPAFEEVIIFGGVFALGGVNNPSS